MSGGEITHHRDGDAGRIREDERDFVKFALSAPVLCQSHPSMRPKDVRKVRGMLELGSYHPAPLQCVSYFRCELEALLSPPPLSALTCLPGHVP